MKEKQAMKSTRGLTLVALVIGILASIPSPGWSQPKTGLESLYLPTYEDPQIPGGAGSCQYLRSFQPEGIFGIWIDYLPNQGEKIACQFDQPKGTWWSCAYQTNDDFTVNKWKTAGSSVKNYQSKGILPKNSIASGPIKSPRIITGFARGTSPYKNPSFISAPKIWVIKTDGTLDYNRISTNQWDFGTTCRDSGKQPNEIPAWSGSYYAIVNAGYPVRIDLSGVKGDSYTVSGFHERLKKDGTAYDIQFKSIPKVWARPSWIGGGTTNCEGQLGKDGDFTDARYCMQGLTSAPQVGAPSALGVDFGKVAEGPLTATPLYPSYPSEDSIEYNAQKQKVEPLTNNDIQVTITSSNIDKGCKHPVGSTKEKTTLTVTTTSTYGDGTQVEFECRLDNDEQVKTVRVVKGKASADFEFKNKGVYRCTATAVGEFHFGVAGAQQVGAIRMFDARTQKPLRMYWDDALVKDNVSRELPDGTEAPVKPTHEGGVIGPADAAPVCSGDKINARCWGNYSKNYGENSIGRTTVMDTWVFYPLSDAFEFTVTASEDPKTADTDGDNTKDFDEGCNGGGNQNPNHNPQDDSNDDDKDGINNKEEGKPDNRDTDGDGKPDYNDDDSDNDGIPDATECRRDNKYSRPGKNNKYYRSVVPGEVNTKDEGCLDSDGDGYPDYIDLDSDNDGIPDAIECTNPGACEDTDGDGIPDYLDLDSDNDGIPDNVEAFISNGKIDASRLINPYDYDKVQNPKAKKVAGLGPRVGMPQEVAKRRMITDISQLADSDGDGIPDFRDTDSDNDGVGDLTESKVNPNGNGATTPGNWKGPNELGVPATAVKKASSEGSQNKDVEVLDFKAGDTAVDANKNGIADQYENPAYNQPNNNSNNSNPKNIIQHRLDADKDGILDHVDPDLDNDGIPDIVERDIEGILPGPRIKDPVTGEMVLDSDGDGIPNYLDVDSDNDGIPDSVECTYSPSHTRDTVDNQSGYVLGCQDSDQGIKTPNALGGGKGDGLPDYIDKDSDDDGILDNVEALRFNPVHGTFHNPEQIIDPKKTAKDVPIKKDSAKNPSDLIGKTLDDLKGNGAPIGSTGDVITISALDDHLAPKHDKVADSDGDGIPDYRDFDSDNDGIPDAYEAYQETPNATQPPTKGIEPSGKDANNNGVDDAFDPACEKDDRCKASWSGKLPMATPDHGAAETQAPVVDNPKKNPLPNYINPDVPADNGGKLPGLSPADDVNHNGVDDKNDPALCTQIPCKQEDLDNLDSDGDGIPDSVEKVKKGEGLAKLYGSDVPTACIPPFVKGVDKSCDEYLDTDGDGIPNFLDKDSDNDGIPDSEECKYNKEKDDKDSYSSSKPTEYVGGCINTDWKVNPGTPDRFPDYLDNDSDGDGVTDNNEAFDYDNDGLADPGFVVPPGTKDVDKNGVPNAVKPGLPTKTEKGGKLKLADADSDGTPNHVDPDSNGDGKFDADQAYDPKIEPLHKDANNNGVDDAFDFACNGTNGCEDPTKKNGGRKVKESPVTTFGPDGTPRKDPNTVAKAFEPHKSSNGKTATYVDCAGKGAKCTTPNNGPTGPSGSQGSTTDGQDGDLDAVGFVAGGCSSTPSEAPQSLWLLLVGAGLAFFRRRKKK